MKKMVILMLVALALASCKTTPESIEINRADPYLLGWAVGYSNACGGFSGYAPDFLKIRYFLEKYEHNEQFNKGYNLNSDLRKFDVVYGFDECPEAAEIINENYAEE